MLAAEVDWLNLVEQFTTTGFVVKNLCLRLFGALRIRKIAAVTIETTRQLVRSMFCPRLWGLHN